MKRIYKILTYCLLLSQAAFSQSQVKPVHTPKIQYFSLSDVRLLDGDFKYIQDLTHRYLLTIEPDRLCSWFRREAGLTPKAQPYPGWESDYGNIIPGHILGFYFSSMSMMYETTGDSEIIKRLEYTLNELDECQDASGDGYLSAVINGKKVFEKVVTGDFNVGNGFIDNVREPTYTMNKITLGLYGVYTKCHLPLAKKVLVRMTDWFGENVLDKIDEAIVQKLLICEHGSLSESFANVYEITGDKKYLDWAHRLNDLRMLIPASEGKDIFAGWHANCQIQKFTGFEYMYRFSGDKKYTDAAQFFWKTVVADHTWSMGGNSTGEYFFPKSEYDTRVLRNGGPEACNSVNMLRLSEALYEDHAKPEVIDYYELVLFNHLLGAYEPERGMIAYMIKLLPGGFKTHSTEYESFWCCTGTGFESPAKFQKMIYTYDAGSLYVNLFIPSEVQWKEKGVTLRQLTKIPDEEQTRLELLMNEPQEFSLKIRHPYWVEKGKLKILVNGKAQKITSSPSQFVEIRRLWKPGDKIVIQLPMKLKATPLSPSQEFVSFAYGPVVLAAEIESGDLKKEDYFHEDDHWGHRTSVMHYVPMEKLSSLIGNPEEITRKTKKASASPLTFRTENAGFPNDYTLIPLNRIHYSRYIVYFPLSKTINEVSERIKAKETLDRITIDHVQVAYDASEKEHCMEAVNSATGTEHGSNWRQATNGGYFMYNLKSLPSGAQSLYLVFRSADAGNRTFDLLVDGHLVKTFNHNQPKENASAPLYPVIVPIPEAITKGKSDITVKFQAKRENTAGALFDLRVIRTSDADIVKP